MPRIARGKSESGIFHLVTKGNGGQILFVERSDYLYHLSLLKNLCQEFSVTILAYCLMDNHVHLLIRDSRDNVSTFMRKLDSAYAVYFNKKYQRSGHVFEDRFKSKPIEGENYLLAAFHYILNNPKHAGICCASDYDWSSYKQYGSQNSFVDTAVFSDLIGDWYAYADFIAEDREEDVFEYNADRRDDRWALTVIQKELGIKTGLDLQNWPWDKRTAALRLLKEKGLTQRQIERLTGINRGIIQKA